MSRPRTTRFTWVNTRTDERAKRIKEIKRELGEQQVDHMANIRAMWRQHSLTLNTI